MYSSSINTHRSGDLLQGQNPSNNSGECLNTVLAICNCHEDWHSASEAYAQRVERTVLESTDFDNLVNLALGQKNLTEETHYHILCLLAQSATKREDAAAVRKLIDAMNDARQKTYNFKSCALIAVTAGKIDLAIELGREAGDNALVEISLNLAQQAHSSSVDVASVIRSIQGQVARDRAYYQCAIEFAGRRLRNDAITFAGQAGSQRTRALAAVHKELGDDRQARWTRADLIQSERDA